MANENIGSIPCSFHDVPLPAVVRRDKKGKLYIYCEECGITSPRAAKFQQYIEKKAVFYSEAVEQKEEEPEAKQVKEEEEWL